MNNRQQIGHPFVIMTQIPSLSPQTTRLALPTPLLESSSLQWPTACADTTVPLRLNHRSRYNRQHCCIRHNTRSPMLKLLHDKPPAFHTPLMRQDTLLCSNHQCLSTRRNNTNAATATAASTVAFSCNGRRTHQCCNCTATT